RDIVASLALHDSVIVDVEASSLATLTWKYPGCVGSGRAMLSLPSIATTSDMVGLSVAFSCTHNNAMLMHLIMSMVQPLTATDASMSSYHLCWFHSCHAYKKFHHRRLSYCGGWGGQHPNSLTRFLCWSFAIVWTSFLNSMKPCPECEASLLTAISDPSGRRPCRKGSQLVTDEKHQQQQDLVSLRGGELGDGLGALGDGVLGELPGEDEADGGLDLAGRDGGLLVVARELGGLGGQLLEDVVDEGVHDGHGLGGDADVGVHLLQHLEDILYVSTLFFPFFRPRFPPSPPPSLPALDLPAGSRFSALGFFPAGAFSAFSAAAGSSSTGFFAAGFFSALGAIGSDARIGWGEVRRRGARRGGVCCWFGLVGEEAPWTPLPLIPSRENTLGRAIFPLPSIETTSDMVGLSIAFSCTHNNAMLMHRIISSVQPFVANDTSTMMISRISTPKLNTSDFAEKRPWEAYSGAIFAIPISEILGFISESKRILLALTSLCITRNRECLCKYRSPCAIPSIITSRLSQFS
ncbi:LOW QUALITY PROTEIN: hypothetical protein U9M48_038650, partial [Paspalum notatum var. saurae]